MKVLRSVGLKYRCADIPESTPSQLMTNQETNKTVALLIAIDKYQDETLSLQGCQNDLEAFQCFLRKRFGDTSLQVTALLNTEATRSGILGGFDLIQHRIRPGDTVIVFYAGHGTQAIIPRKSGNLEDDSPARVELLCPYDYDKDTNRNAISDFKLQDLLKKLPKQNCNLTVILDCCHSGSLTRGKVLRVRQVRSSTVPSIYDIPPAEQHLWPPSSRDVVPESYVLLAACQKNECAFECSLGGRIRGCFTACLIDLLDTASPSTTYDDLQRKFTYQQHTSRSGSNLPSGQNPVCDGTRRYRYLFQATESETQRFRVVTDRSNSEWIYLTNAGKIQGITDGTVLGIKYANQTIFVTLKGVDGASSRFSGKGIDNKLLEVLRGSPDQVHIFPRIIGERSPLRILYHAGFNRNAFPLPPVDPQSNYMLTAVSEHFSIASTQEGLMLYNPYDHPPRNLPSEGSELQRVLQSVSNFSYHLTRDIGNLHGGVTLSLEAVDREDSVILREPEVNDANRNFAQVCYKIKITNNSPDNYYFYLFFFDPHTYEIQSVWSSSSLIGGFHSRRDSKQREERVTDRRWTITISDTDTNGFGFFRLFASVTPVVMDIAQPSPWSVPGSAKEDSYRLDRKEMVYQPYGASTYKVPYSWKPRDFEEEARSDVHDPNTVESTSADEVSDFIGDDF